MAVVGFDIYLATPPSTSVHCTVFNDNRKEVVYIYVMLCALYYMLSHQGMKHEVVNMKNSREGFHGRF